VEKPYVLHMFTTAKNLSPFDVNMALDAGWISAMPYTNVTVDEIQALVQDAIFSRSLKSVKRTGIFIGGRDTFTAMQMLHAAKESMVPPFEVSVFADPSGAFTTAAAMVAVAENLLTRNHNGLTLQGQNVLVLGGTGPVGQIAAVLSAQAGANVWIVGRQLEKASQIAAQCNQAFGGGKISIQAEADSNKAELIKTADVVFATAAAGVQVLDETLMATATRLKVAADVNAVPPSGIADVAPHDNGTPIIGSVSGALGIGALAMGSVKYQTQSRLLNTMLERQDGKPVYLHYEHAFEIARKLVAGTA
jgi:methylene-tetrahydromethanopterin dehydrogenase